MGGMQPGSAREEAERLVATLLATARLATSGPGAGPWAPLGGILSGVLGHSEGAGRSTGPFADAGGPDGATGAGFATGTAECCICPVCRGIAALRDPSPEFAERLATGAGDLAAGVASLLRAFASAGAPEPGSREATGPAGRPAGEGDGDDVWREATRTGHDSQPTPEQDVWSAATRGEGAAAPAAVVPPADVAGSHVPAPGRPAAGGPVVPASRAPSEAVGDAPGDGA